MTVENVVAQHQGASVVTDEALADQEGLGEAIGAGLHFVLDAEAPALAIAEQSLEERLLVWRRDDQDLPNPRQHQRGERVVDHRLVVDRHELLTHALGEGMQAGARAAGQNDALLDHRIASIPRGLGS